MSTDYSNITVTIIMTTISLRQ